MPIEFQTSIQICDLNSGHSLVWYLDAFWIADHSTTRKIIIIQIPNRSRIQIPTVF